jgi:tousled-like kinase
LFDLFLRESRKEIELAEKLKELQASSESYKKQSEVELSSYREKIAGLQEKLDLFQKQSLDTKIAILRDLTSQEDSLRYQKLLHDNMRIGSVTTRRDGHIVQDFWEDGEEFKSLRVQKVKLEHEKESLENIKKVISKIKSSLNSARGQEAECLKVELLETEEIYKFRLSLFKKDIASCLEKENDLELQKSLHIRFSKLYIDESISRYNSHPVLNSRYILHYLIGKGGFSEVYKAYDFVENRFVALKLHEISSQWNEERKENFVRHAYRETSILQSLNHPRIVRCYDV